MRFLAGSLGTVLSILSALHVYWAVRGVNGGIAIPSRPDGSPVLAPTRFASLAVAAALALAAGLVLARGNLLAAFAPAVVIKTGTWGVAAAFAARAIGDFRYVGFFRRVRGTAFARWDARCFTPLCAALATGTAWLAAS